MSWIEDEAREIKHLNEHQEGARDWALHKARLLEERKFTVWAAILRQIRNDVAAFNGNLGVDPRLQIRIHEAPAHSVTLVKNLHPMVTVTMQIHASGKTITIAVRQIHDPLGLPIEMSDVITVDMDEHENIEFYQGEERLLSVADVSKSVLRPILNAYRK